MLIIVSMMKNWKVIFVIQTNLTGFVDSKKKKKLNWEPYFQATFDLNK